MKNYSFKIELELEKELESVKDTIEQKKQEMMTKVKEGKAIRSSLESIPGSAEEDKQQITEVDAIRLKALPAIHDALNL